jgi:translation initiation factor 2B subunit (eIF-2B alpha/beta/delta family)
MKIELFEEVLRDNVSGSGTIVSKVQDALINHLKENQEMDFDLLHDELQTIKMQFPQFGVLFHFLKTFEDAFSENERLQFTEVKGFIDQYRKQWDSVQELAINRFLETVDLADKSVLLHSNSSAVNQIFEKRVHKPCKPEIFQTLSSPANEGVDQAKKLSALGYHVRLFHEDALSKYLDKIDLAILGADLILDDEFLNKIGSFPITLLCNYFGKPVYVIADRRKKFSSHDLSEYELALFRNEQPKPACEVTTEEIPNTRILNEYFEFTPLHLVERLFL